MWRTLLLGKLTISILASLAVGGICFAHPYQTELGFAAATRWTGLGVFFLLLAAAQVLAIVLLFKKNQPEPTKKPGPQAPMDQANIV